MIRIGLSLTTVSAILIVMAFSTTHIVVVPGTFTTTEVSGSPTAGLWLLFVGSLILAGIGFARRVLAALERG